MSEKLKKFRVYGVGYYSTSDDEIVEAKDSDEACDKATLSAPQLCHHCARIVEINDIERYEAEEVDDE